MNTRIRTCLITAPAGGNFEVLIDALRQREIRVVAPEHLAGGREIGSEIIDLMARVDLVIGVMTRERRSEWALFELGIAWGLGKRILLFVPPNSSHLPSSLRRFVTVRSSISNREAVQFALDQLLAAPDNTESAAIPRERLRPLGPSAENYLQGSFRIGTTLGGEKLERLVADALRDAGVEVVTEAPDKDLGADLAIWSDALQATVGNPFLIEVKSQLPTHNLTAMIQRFAQQVAAAGGFWGLLLYASGPDKPRGLPPNVLALPIDVLFKRLKTETFEEIVRDLRNRRVHGSNLP